jgi:hypothetical protein
VLALFVLFRFKTKYRGRSTNKVRLFFFGPPVLAIYVVFEIFLEILRGC